MSRRITKLSESPCYKCDKNGACRKKVKKNPVALCDIVENMYPDAEADYANCPIYIALTAPDMIEVEDG